MSYSFTAAKRTIIGKGALSDCEAYVISLGKKALIVSGKHVTKSGVVKKFTDILEKNNIAFTIFNDIPGEPTDKMIEEGVKVFLDEKCDFVVGIGGGSPQDSAKAIVAAAIGGKKITEYKGKEISGKFPPLVLIPTTAGTGSEATKFLCVTDTSNDTKLLLKGDDLIPDIAVIDPELSVSTPKSITAATGMDALTHAVESYTSRKANTLTDMYALDAIKRIFEYLPIAYENGNDLKAREEMAIAAYEAGVCINNASVTLVHGMSRPIGALFHVPHGISNAMLIAKCLEFALDGAYDKFADIARAIGVATKETDDKAAAHAFIGALNDICKTLEIPTLAEYGIHMADFFNVIDKMSSDAIASGSPANTIKEVTKDNIMEIYKNLWT